MMKIVMIDGVEYETEAELSHLLDRDGAELLAQIREQDERGYEIGDDPVAPPRGFYWRLGLSSWRRSWWHGLFGKYPSRDSGPSRTRFQHRVGNDLICIGALPLRTKPLRLVNCPAGLC